MSAAAIINKLGGNPASGMCRCPAHEERTASLHVREGSNGKVLVHCHAGCSQERVITALKSQGLWPAGATQQQGKGERKHTTAREENERFRRAFAILRAAGYADAGTPNEYLKGRGIDIVPDCAMLLPAKDSARLTGKRFPAMVVPIIEGGRLVGAQVTHLTKDATRNLRGMHTKKNLRNTYGKGGYVQLAEIDPQQPLLTGEGIEDVLSAMQIAGFPGIATLGTSGMKSVNPPECSEVIIVGDNDDAGRKAAKALSQRLAEEGRRVRIAIPESDGEDWNDVLHKDGDKLEELRQQILGGKLVKRAREVKALGMQAFIALQFPPREYLLKPWLTTTGLAMVDAAAGHGKTWLGLSIAYAVASGRPLLDWAVERRGRVLYVDGELAGELLQNRLQMLGPALPESDLKVISHAQFEMRNALMPDLGEPAGRDFLDKVIEENKIELIILDSVSTLVRSGIDNDVEGWRAIQSWSLRHRAKGRAIIYLHHHGRSGNPRGTSAREIVLDARIKLARDYQASTDNESAFQLQFPKARDFWGADEAPMIAYLSTETGQVQWRRESVKDRTKERVRELREQGVKQKDIAQELGVSQPRVSQIIAEITREETQARERA